MTDLLARVKWGACIQCGLVLLPDVCVLIQHELLGEVAPVALLRHSPLSSFPVSFSLIIRRGGPEHHPF